MPTHLMPVEELVLVWTRTCSVCGETGRVLVTKAEFRDLAAWARQTIPLDEALPARSDAFREQVRSGIHPGCWGVALFGRAT